MNRRILAVTLLAIGVVTIAVALQIMLTRQGDAPLMRLDGTPVTVDMAAAPVTILHFWGTWCPPCRTEIPAFSRFVRDSAGAKYRIVAVAVEPNGKEVAAFLAQTGARIDSMLDPYGNYASTFEIEAFPTTLVIDRQGKILQRVVGPVDWDDPGVRAHLKSLAE